jgi:hypothetical protein
MRTAPDLLQRCGTWGEKRIVGQCGKDFKRLAGVYGGPVLTVVNVKEGEQRPPSSDNSTLPSLPSGGSFLVLLTKNSPCIARSLQTDHW